MTSSFFCRLFQVSDYEQNQGIHPSAKRVQQEQNSNCWLLKGAPLTVIIGYLNELLAINNQKFIPGGPFLQPFDLISLTEEMDD